jgi:hypothetical protein
VLAVALVALIHAAPAPPANSSVAAVKRLAALAGDWTGTFEWSGARSERGTLDARYSTTGYGSAVVETLISDDVASMTSVYHADGADLRMTHYCGAGNQPRLKASKIDVAAGAFDFAYVDATNLSAPDAPRVTGVELRLADENHLTLTFVFEWKKKSARERISLHRIPSGS